MGITEPGEVAAVKLPSGKLVWVEGVPASLEIGAIVRLEESVRESTGTVEIPPRLVVWRDPKACCARFVTIEKPSAHTAAPDARPPVASLVSPDLPTTGPGREEIMDLAWREISLSDR